MADLACPACGRSYADRWRCACGSPLEFTRSPRPGRFAPDPLDGLWTFHRFIPVERQVTLGEGYTPVVDAPDRDVSFKLEYVAPTGSFKDRGAAVTISRGVDLGVDRVVEDSSGNAGAAIATYAARAGMDCSVYVPADVTPSKVRAIERAGADVEYVDGSRESVAEACVAAVEDGRGWYASHVWNPAFLEGTATFAYELAHQRDWDVPDAVVFPIGHGTLFLGAHRGFQRLRAAGWIDEVPRLFGVQAAGYAPIAAEVGSTEPDRGTNELADGIQISEPVRRDGVLAAIDATEGDCIAVDGAATRRELDALHDAGFYVEPTSAVAPAGLRVYRERGTIDPDDDVAVALTGSGLKAESFSTGPASIGR